ncbi:MAG: ATP-binding protein [Candidatus Omnitrophota bacterium]
MMTKKIYPLSKVSVDDTRVELNCRAVKAIILYFGNIYGQQELENFVYKTQMSLDYLEDPHNWISFDYFCRLLKSLVEYTGDPKAPYNAGIYTCKVKTFGALSNIASRFGSPRSMYKLTVEVSPMYAKMDTFSISDLKRNSCTITLRMNKGYKQDKNNCLNLQGTFASIPLLWNLPQAKVKEEECSADGKEACVYKVTWKNKPSHLFGILGFLAGLVALASVKLYFFNESLFTLLSLLPIVGLFIGKNMAYKKVLSENLNANEEESKDLLESLLTIEKLNIELQGKVEKRTEELNASNEELKMALTKLKESQEQLIQSEKMASVGQLAAGMAHELNNPVGAIRNYLQDILEDTKKDDPRWERIKSAEKATWRCRKIVSELLTFARESYEGEATDINVIIESLITHAKEGISNPKIVIINELTPALPRVRVDGPQIKQVLMNIIMNAADAIEEEGAINIKTSSNGPNLLIEITDTGTGISKDIQTKIFDPFFTTKPPGKGTGLGLAISYNIINRFNGNIQVKSEEGQGSAFLITLPVVVEN